MLRFNDEPGGQVPVPAPARTATPTPTPATFSADNFFDALPEDLRNHASLAKTGGKLETLSRSYIAAQQMIGRDPASLVEIPKADATFEDRLAILNRLGAPKEVSGYKLVLPDTLHADAAKAMDPKTPFGQTFLDTALKMGLLPEQVQGLYSAVASGVSEAIAAQEVAAGTNHDAEVAALEKEAGAAFNDWVRAAEFAIEKLGGDPLRNAINNAGLGTNPHIVKALMQVGKLLSEDTVGDSRSEGGSRFGTLAPAEARARGTDLLNKALSEKNPTERKRLNEEAQKFFALASGSKKVAL